MVSLRAAIGVGPGPRLHGDDNAIKSPSLGNVSLDQAASARANNAASGCVMTISMPSFSPVSVNPIALGRTATDCLHAARTTAATG